MYIVTNRTHYNHYDRVKICQLLPVYTGSSLQTSLSTNRSLIPSRVKIFHHKKFIQSLGPTQPAIRWVLGSLPSRVKLPSCEDDYLPPSTRRKKNTWIYNSTSPYVFIVSTVIILRPAFIPLCLV